MKITINPNKEKAAQIKDQVNMNSGFCPCKLIRNEDTKCMCKEFRNQELGECHCGLYVKTEE